MSTSNSNSDIGKDEVASETKNFLPMSSSDFNEGEDDASYYSDDSYEYDYSGDDGLDGRALQPAYQSLYNPDRISCPFCCEEQIDPGCGLILPKCLHSPCVKCFTKYVQTEVENGNADNIKCPFCNETVEMDVLKEVLDETSFQRLERLKDSAFVLKNPDYHHCPTPDCNGIVLCQVVVETETSANSSHSGDEVVHQLPSVPAVGQATEAKASPPPSICDCFKCGKTSCLSCGLPFHKGITCEEYELQQQMFGEVMCIRTQVVSYIEPLQATLEYHNEGYAAAIASGDTFQAVLNLYTSYLSLFHAGVKLQTTREKGEEVINFIRERKMVVFVLQIQLIQNSLLKLIGIDEDSKNSSSEEESILATKNGNIQMTYFFQKSYDSFMFRLYDDTKDYAEKFVGCVASSAFANLTAVQSFITFYIGLISFWVARNSRDGDKWHERGNKSKLALKKWAETSQWTFESNWYLLEAEEAFSNSNFDDARMYYEKAISSAKAHKFVHEEALACELAAYFYLDIGEVNIAADYFLLAHERYQEWGAIGKCASLFKFCGSVMNNCVGSSSAIAADLQFDLAQEQSVGRAEFEEEEETRNADVYAAEPAARTGPCQSDGDRSGEESSVSVGGGNENDVEVYVDWNDDEEEGLKPKQVSTETADHGSSQENDDDMPDIEDDVNGSGAAQTNQQEDEDEGEGRNQIVAGNRAMLSEMEDLREELYAKGRSEAKLKAELEAKSNDLRATQNEVHRLSNEINDDPRAEAGANSKTCADGDSDQDEIRRFRGDIETKNKEITRLCHEPPTTATTAQESIPDYIIEAGNICVDRVAEESPTKSF